MNSHWGFVAVLAAICGGLAMLLAATGICGVLNYQVSRRMPEMGTRMALGADDLLALLLLPPAALLGCWHPARRAAAANAAALIRAQ
jgi:hypothetical protein